MAYSLERSLLDKATKGDPEAMGTLARDLIPHIERQLIRYPVTEEDRRDLLQATLMQIMRRLGSFRGDSSFSTWLFRVTANEALMMMRSQRRVRARVTTGLDLEDLGKLPSTDEVVPADVSVDNNDRDARVREALDALPNSYRDVVMAHYHQDLGLQEIADRYDLTESAVRSRLHRARARLRTMLESPTPIARQSSDYGLDFAAE